jgi:carbon storage regulator CsrA
MLVLSRKPGEKVVIGGGITVTVIEVQGNRVRVGIDAPDQVRILRGELACWQEGPVACDGPTDPACPCGEEDVRPPP